MGIQNKRESELTSKSSKTEEPVTEPPVNVTTESSNLNVTDNTTSESTTKPPSNLTKEKEFMHKSDVTKSGDLDLNEFVTYLTEHEKPCPRLSLLTIKSTSLNRARRPSRTS